MSIRQQCVAHIEHTDDREADDELQDDRYGQVCLRGKRPAICYRAR